MKKNYFALYLLFSFLFLSLTSKAQDVPPKLAQALQHTLDSMRQVLDVRGLSAAVQLPNDAVWAGSDGVSTYSPLDSLTEEHIFESGSSTKTITSMFSTPQQNASSTAPSF